MVVLIRSVQVLGGGGNTSAALIGALGNHRYHLLLMVLIQTFVWFIGGTIFVVGNCLELCSSQQGF